MADDGFVEVWFMWNDGRKERGSLANTLPSFYIGRFRTPQSDQRYKFCDLTNSPYLEQIKAMADLVGEAEDSKKRRNSIPWSDKFLIPEEWASAWWDDPRGGVNYD